LTDQEKLKKFALIDANINRVGEGLRVVEDWARFYLRDEQLTLEVRSLRHDLWKEAESSYPQIVKGRDTGHDILAEKKEKGRKSVEDIPKASFNRVKEGLRVLEEMGKLISVSASKKFKDMRFKVYELEKIFYEKSAE